MCAVCRSTGFGVAVVLFALSFVIVTAFSFSLLALLAFVGPKCVATSGRRLFGHIRVVFDEEFG
jgi:hypothetical protein